MNFKFNRSDVLLAIASVCLALLLWIQIQSQVDPHLVREYSIPLEIRSLKNGLAVAHAPNYVTIIAEGTESELNQISLDRLKAYVNLSQAKVGQKSYHIKFLNLSNTSATLALSHPQEVIAIEKLVTKDINVTLEEQGLPPAGLLYAGASVNPDKVVLQGPETQVAQVAKARVILNLAALRPGHLIPAIIEVLGNKNQQIPSVYPKPAIVMINPSVAPAPASKNIPINPLWQGSVAFGYKIVGYQIRPSQIKIKGKSSVLANIDALDTEPVSLDKLDRDTKLEVGLKIPRGIEIIGNSDIYVTIKIAPSSAHTAVETQQQDHERNSSH